MSLNNFNGTSPTLLEPLSRVDTEVELEVWSRTMESLWSRVLQMKQRRIILLNRLNAATAFHLRLPLDIITHIFTIIINSQDSGEFRSLPAPLILGRVCSEWRHIVHSDPGLWTLIILCFSPSRSRGQEILLREWLCRSGNRGMRLYLYTLEEEWSILLESFSSLILESSTRWEVFHCFAKIHLRQSRILLLSPFLKSVRILLHERSRYDLRSASQLRHLNLCGPSPRTLLVNWSNLYTLRLSTSAITEYRLIFVLLEEIRRMEIVSFESHEVDISIIFPIPLLLLSVLRIHGDLNCVSIVLRSITAPSLTELVIDTRPDNDEWCDLLIAMQERSGFKHLSVLAITNFLSTEEELILLMDSMESVARLMLVERETEFELSDNFVDHLNPGFASPGTCILPGLKEFCFSGRISFQPYNLLAMLEERLAWAINCEEYKTMFQRDAPWIDSIHTVDIHYMNAGWINEGDFCNPNNLEEFFKHKLGLVSRGVDISLIWE